MAEFLRVAADAARRAGEYQREQFGSPVDFEYKSPSDPVSEVDRESDRRIEDRLLTAFPDHAVRSEERGRIGDDGATHTWIVDPLDGSANFLHGDPDFAVSIALAADDTVVAGVVYRPMSDTLYAAARTDDAVVADVEGLENEAVGVSDRSRLQTAHVALPYPPSGARRDDVWATHRALGGAGAGIRTSGAAALDLSSLAAGRLDAVVGFDHRRWDVAAGLLLVELAGGRTVDRTDGHDEGGDFLATNGDLHAAVVSRLPDRDE